jgi:serine/threonine protein kinase
LLLAHGRELTIVLSDFGLALDCANEDRGQVKRCGTPIFMAPEVAAGRQRDQVISEVLEIIPELKKALGVIGAGYGQPADM